MAEKKFIKVQKHDKIAQNPENGKDEKQNNASRKKNAVDVVFQ